MPFGKGIKRIKAALVCTVLIGFAGVAGAATCTQFGVTNGGSTSGVTITRIDATTYAPAISASACELRAGNVDQNTFFEDNLNNGTFFAGLFGADTTWARLPKASLTSSIGDKAGTWTADFAPNKVANVVVALKGGPNFGLFLFKDLPIAGSEFWGTFDMKLAGVLTGSGKGGAGLSNFNVAGIYISNGYTTIPLPAAGWLLLSGLGALGFAGYRRRRQAA